MDLRIYPTTTPPAVGRFAVGSTPVQVALTKPVPPPLVNRDVELVMAQTGCTRIEAIEALRRNDDDLVATIMELMHD